MMFDPVLPSDSISDLLNIIKIEKYKKPQKFARLFPYSAQVTACSGDE